MMGSIGGRVSLLKAWILLYDYLFKEEMIEKKMGF